MKKFTCTLIAWLAVCFVSSVALADWDQGDGHKMHYPQTPKLGGLGVEFNGLTSMADDFECSQSGDITDIHIWIAWKGDVVEPITNFRVAIWSDEPATENSHSMPRDALWERVFTEGEFVVRDMPDDLQGWFDPNANTITPFDHWQWQQINITDIIDPFYQDQGTIYWLMFNFNDMDPIGWKETDQNFNDAAVWYDLFASQWRPLVNPDTGQNIDLAFVINYSEPEPLDYGDAPDPLSGIPGQYPTLRENNGARHIAGGPWLGDAADAPDQEFDGQASGNATGDDTDGFDDENGVTFPVDLVPGYSGSVIFEVNGAGAGANVDGWVDFNADGVWDAFEKIVSGNYTNGLHSVIFPVPPGATVGQTFSRFRISTDATVFGSVYGKAQDGEVEDHAVTIDQGPQGLDFGDAPDLYPTLLGSNGARHHIVGVPWLGDPFDGPDAETNGQPTFSADGDDNLDGNDDENGVMMPIAMNQGVPASITIEVGLGGGFVDAWIDWNIDYTWDFSEQIHNAYLPSGIHTITVVPPLGAALGQTYARFRISSTGGLWPDGLATDGEVEDYEVTIEPGPQDYDYGDAPDSQYSPMTAYPDGTPAYYPTVFGFGPPYGPRHAAPKSSAWLGIDATIEDEADTGVDQDGINNIDPPSDLSDRDGADDGLLPPVKMPRCKKTTVTYEVTIADPTKPYYVNIWCDFNRDGDWDDLVFGCAQDVVPEWAVRNQMIDGLPTGTFLITSLPFVSWHPANGPDELWMRITISEQPWQEIWRVGGCGPDSGIGYTAGETEDYLITPETACVECADLNCSGLVDLADFAIFASQWLGTCP